jgi:hypothetical protein
VRGDFALSEAVARLPKQVERCGEGHRRPCWEFLRTL